MKRLFLEPLDVLLFRRSQPFAAGDGARAASAFPPTVIPFQGAIRTLLLEEMGVPFEDYTRPGPPRDARVERARIVLGDPNKADDPSAADDLSRDHDLGCLRIRGPYLARQTAEGAIQTLFPAPRNALWEAGSRSLRMLAPLLADAGADDGSCLIAGSGGTSATGPCALLWDADAQGAGASTQGLLITGAGLRAVLGGGQPRADQLVQEDALYKSERRAGIARDSGSRIAVDGMLYSVDFVRLEAGVGFFLEVQLEARAGLEVGNLLPDAGFLTLGGERRSVRFRAVSSDEVGDWETLLVPPSLGASRCLLYLATHAVFRPGTLEEPGWLPHGVDGQTLEATEGSAAGLRIVTAALGKPTAVGGWDLAKRQPKPLRWAVPAGSVYYCEITRDPQEVVGALHAQTISDYLPDAGMGQVFVGRWPDVE